MKASEINFPSLFEFTQAGPFYVGIGGIGDFLLSAAICFKHGVKRLVFWCSTGYTLAVQEMCDAFGIEHFVIDFFPKGHPCAFFAWQANCRHRNLIVSPIVPSNLDYSFWSKQENELMAKLAFTMPGRELFGKMPKKTLPAVCVAPRGSNVGKTLYKDEFSAIVSRFAQANWHVYAVGSESDIKFYKEDRCTWISTKTIVDQDGAYPLKTNMMFAILNSCDLVVSVDSWVKTYSCLIETPTVVFMNRQPGSKSHFNNSGGDMIFLNRKFWKTMTLMAIEDFFAVSGKANTLSRILDPKNRPRIDAMPPSLRCL